MSSSAFYSNLTLSKEVEDSIRESLRRCSPETVEAALGFRRTGDKALLMPLVLGMLERFVDPELRQKVREAGPELRLIEDLSLDSLTMMEIIIMVEEVLGITISNEEAQTLRTVGDIRAFAGAKVDAFVSSASESNA